MSTRRLVTPAPRRPDRNDLNRASSRLFALFGCAHDLADLGWMLAEQERVMADRTTVLPTMSMPILTVKLADWVRDFDATLAHVPGHCCLPPDPACARFHERDCEVRAVSLSQVRQPVNARGIGRWTAYAAELDAAGCLAAWPSAARHS